MVDEVLWSWRSYKALHNGWGRNVDGARERIESAIDDKERTRHQKYHDTLLKREPSEPAFECMTPCRIDPRTDRIEKALISTSSIYGCIYRLSARE